MSYYQKLGETKGQNQLLGKEHIKQLLQVNSRVNTILSEKSRCFQKKENSISNESLKNDIYRLKNVLSIIGVNKSLILPLQDTIQSLSGNNVISFKSNQEKS